MSVQKPALRYGTSHAAGPTALCKYLTSFLVVVVVFFATFVVEIESVSTFILNLLKLLFMYSSSQPALS